MVDIERLGPLAQYLISQSWRLYSSVGIIRGLSLIAWRKAAIASSFFP